MSTNEKTIDEQLSGLPIKEKQNAIEKNRLLQALKHGEVKLITLEKKFTPANEITQFVIVEHLVGQPGSKTNTHTHNELSGHAWYDDAQRIFREKIYNNQFEIKSTDAVRELLLVGKYGSGELQYNKDGELDKTSGITLDYALTLPGRSYDLTSARDPYEPVTVQEKLYLRLDLKTDIIQLLDGSMSEVKLSDFWIQLEGPTLNKVKIPPKDIDEIELLPKHTLNQISKNGIKH